MPRLNSGKDRPRRVSGDTAAPLTTDLEQRFARGQSKLNGRRRELMREILDKPEETYFLSARAIARRYDVNAATLVRTIQALGYSGFAEFAADLRRHFVMRITPYELARSAAKHKASAADQVLQQIEKDAENLQLLLQNLDVTRLLELARAIHSARRILVVGVDLAASLSGFLAYGLTVLGFDADAPVGSSGNLLHKVRGLDSKDLLIAISFRRCLRETVESVQRARKRGVPTFGITDSDSSPIATACHDHLLALISSPVFTGSYVAPISLLNAILGACTQIRPQRMLARLRAGDRDYMASPRWYSEPAAARAGPK
ncbi:MAG: MurR/RpiR family transcriptional regulator [Bryobacteraceae bacterium]